MISLSENGEMKIEIANAEYEIPKKQCKRDCKSSYDKHLNNVQASMSKDGTTFEIAKCDALK